VVSTRSTSCDFRIHTSATSHSCSSSPKSSGPTPTPWKVSRRRNRSRIVRSQYAGACSRLQDAFMSLGWRHRNHVILQMSAYKQLSRVVGVERRWGRKGGWMTDASTARPLAIQSNKIAGTGYRRPHLPFSSGYVPSHLRQKCFKCSRGG